MWEYRAALTEILDGDTIRLWVDLGCFVGRHHMDVRLLGVSAPELRDPGGPETKDFVQAWMYTLNPDLSWPMLINTQTTKVTEPTEKQSFTRYIADIRNITNGDHLNAQLRHWLSQHPEWGGGT
jgi:hypothetical protein